MTTTITAHQTRHTPLLTGLGLALLWLALGFLTAGTTYHLAPLLIAGIPAILFSLEDPQPAPARIVLQALAGATAASTVTLVLATSGNLEGPSLLPFGGAVAEAVVFIPVGALAGLAVGFLRGARLRHR